MAPQTLIEPGRLNAIAKILDRAGGHLSSAVDPSARPLAQDRQGAATIDGLLALSRSASHDVVRAVQLAGGGDLPRALAHLESARTVSDTYPASVSALPQPLPSGVRTALQLLRGITGFFTAETEAAFVRALSIDGGRAA
ncbi:hypothetical protein [Streptomyces sp. NPDC060194]|uniref:hypothetical protein n=1 Tax=Streptomyces sp. NPDC060194 TaxID=3347069 RepID=UPI00365F13D2